MPNSKDISDNKSSDEFEYHYWESEPYRKSFVTTKSRSETFLYYDTSSVVKFLFFHWATKWTNYLSNRYKEPYKLHPLPVSDQVLYWQPIFSKHVSDALVKLESYETLKSKFDKVDRRFHPYRSIILRALFLTFWKRLLFVIVGIIATNVLSMSIAILVKRLFLYLDNRAISFLRLLLLLIIIVVLQLTDALVSENIGYYVFRLVNIVHYSFSITLLQHGMCFRRKYFNNIEGYNSLNACNSVLHSCSPESECSKNPLFCPALRYQNKDMDSQMITFQFNDSYYFSRSVESLKVIVEFLSKFFYGVYLMSNQIKSNMWVLYLTGLFILFAMILFEVFSAYMYHYILYCRDVKISKCNEIIPSLPLINKMLYDDIAINIITKSRNNELKLYFVKLLLTFSNQALYIICFNLSFLILKNHFVKSILNCYIITEIDTAAFLTTFYIFLKIFDSMFLIPYALYTLTSSYVTLKRVSRFIVTASPNFYIGDNRFIGSTNMSSVISETTTDLEKDVVVLYKDATFTWVSSRNDLLTKNYQPYLKNVNFELRRGEIAIVTGSQGSGKSNFIKSVLGEMTLVGGSMAVVPLHTSMPIFYASQDAWLERGTIRSNILFGYTFDEAIYNTVLKAVELKSDISTWEKGDMRVVSNNAHSLSGGQRVRVQMARAIYAYLIFSQVNKQYNNNKCSFLMCLDSSFNGLDPFVAKTVFSNLFNIKSGILIREDLSVILSFSKESLDRCALLTNLNNFPTIPVYNVADKSVSCSNLSDFLSTNKKVDGYVYRPKSSGSIYRMNYFSNETFNLCLSGSLTRLGRREVTKLKYEESFKTYFRNQPHSRFNPFLIFISPALFSYIVFIVITIALTVLDSIKFVIGTKLSDYITKNINHYKGGELIHLSDVKSHSKYLSQILTFLVSLNITLSLILTILISVSCIITSRKINEYCINSIFKNSSREILIKKQVNLVISFLSCDIPMIDEDFSHSMPQALISLVNTVINLLTFIYLIPLSIPFFVLSLILYYKYVFMKYINSLRVLQMAYIEANSHISSDCENAISGAPMYRSYKKEWELVYSFMENTDYKSRPVNFIFVLGAWVSISFNWIISITSLVILIVQLIFYKTTKYNFKVGYFGLGLSLSMKIMNTLKIFILNITHMKFSTCSIERFECFIPLGQKCKFDKYRNVNVEDVVINSIYSGLSENQVKESLLFRRRNEFKEKNFKFHSIRKLGFRPKINVIDLNQFLSPDHFGVELKDVHVYTSPELNKNGAILKGITASAYKSDIIGIIGRTGSGKTTLLTVLQNIVRYRTGQVLLDGTDLKDIPKNVIRHIIGVLPQLPFVFKGWTVRRFLDPRKLFSDEEINQALDMCGLLQFVNDLQGGKKLDSVIIPDNITSYMQHEKVTSLNVQNLKEYYDRCDLLLSNTQLRTLSFARLVLYRSLYRIILVDEPPSENCDTDDQPKTVSDSSDAGMPICELLKRYFQHCTTFITAHEANVLQMCNSVWILHHGSFVGKCGIDEILKDNSISNIIENLIKT